MRVVAHPDDHRAAEEEVLELVGVAVGADVEHVLVPADLLEAQAAPLHKGAACGQGCGPDVRVCGLGLRLGRAEVGVGQV